MKFFLVMLLIVMGVIYVATSYVEKHRQVVHITEKDIVRYCMERRRTHASEKSVTYYCKDLGGDRYAAEGFKPNYDEFPPMN